MLSKLLKYEFKATSRVFLPAYAVLLIAGAIQKIMLQFGFYNKDMGVFSKILGSIVPSLLGAAVVAIFVVTLVVMINRFRKSLLGREGYLMFTLPVNTSQLILSKAIAVLAWAILSCIIGLITVVILVYDTDFVNFVNDAIGLVGEASRQAGASNVVLFFIETVLTFIFGIVNLTFMVYLCLSIGQLSNKHRGLCAIGAFVGINFVLRNIILAIISNVLFTDKFVPPFYLCGYDTASIVGILQMMNAFMLAGLVIVIIELLIYFFITKYILSNKLNLE